MSDTINVDLSSSSKEDIAFKLFSIIFDYKKMKENGFKNLAPHDFKNWCLNRYSECLWAVENPAQNLPE